MDKIVADLPADPHSLLCDPGCRVFCLFVVRAVFQQEGLIFSVFFEKLCCADFRFPIVVYWSTA